MSRLHRTDANQKAITNGLKALGYTVHDMSGAGRLIPGFPDIIVIGNNHDSGKVEICYVEIKTEKGKLNKDQVKFHSEFYERHGADAPLIVAKCLDDVLRKFGALWEG